MFIPLPQLQQLLKYLHPHLLQLPRIHQLLVVLPPGAHVAFLRNELGGLTVVGFQKVDGLLPFGEPEFVLGRKRNCEYQEFRHTLYCYNCRYPDADADQWLLNFFHKVSHGY